MLRTKKWMIGYTVEGEVTASFTVERRARMKCEYMQVAPEGNVVQYHPTIMKTLHFHLQCII